MPYNTIPDSVRKTLLSQRSILQNERLKIDAEIADIDAFLNPVFEVGLTLPTAVPKAFALTEGKVPISRRIIDFAAANILPGVSLTTEKIYHLMVVNGAKFPPEGNSPQSRITRVISGTGLYKGHKSKGWTLAPKEDDPAATGS
jgi:hypothetical protein